MTVVDNIYIYIYIYILIDEMSQIDANHQGGILPLVSNFLTQ